jgi:hypothetical protein
MTAQQIAASRFIRLLREVRAKRLQRVRTFADAVASSTFNEALPELVAVIRCVATAPLTLSATSARRWRSPVATPSPLPLLPSPAATPTRR